MTHPNNVQACLIIFIFSCPAKTLDDLQAGTVQFQGSFPDLTSQFTILIIQGQMGPDDPGFDNGRAGLIGFVM